MDWQPGAAISVALAFFVVFWMVYDGICQIFGRRKNGDTIVGVLIMSFSHAEDLDIVIACLKRLRERDDLPYVGLIGSKTKWATFRHRLEARGFTGAELARVTCPIGVQGIGGKEPEVIAVAVAAQLLQGLP